LPTGREFTRKLQITKRKRFDTVSGNTEIGMVEIPVETIVSLFRVTKVICTLPARPRANDALLLPKP